MATGHTHDRITFICFPLLAGASFGLSRSAELTCWVASSFLFSGLMFGPDLDIHSKQSIRWGWLQWLWYPYRRWIPHRSIFSHGPMIGTIIRILYLSGSVVCLVFLAHYLLRLMGQPVGEMSQLTTTLRRSIAQYQSQLLAAFIGLELGAMSHYLADIYSSKLNQFGRRLTRRKKKKVRG